jgi:uncharacterized integral membrane protein
MSHPTSQEPAPGQQPLAPTTAPAPGPPSTGPLPPAPTAGPQPPKPVDRTRTGGVWVAVCGAALLAILLIVFMLQNTRRVQVHFLGLSGTTSLALMLLIAVVGAVLLTLIIGSARIVQLRRAVRRRSR